MLKELLKSFSPGLPDALVCVYLREQRLLIRTYDRTPVRTAGFWCGTGPIVALDASADPVSVGQTVLDALAKSRLDVPVPERGVKLEGPLYKAAGVTSQRALVAGTRLCTINRHNNAITVEPAHNGGKSGEDRGFRPLAAEHWVHLDALPTADALGRAVFTGLERSTIAPGV